ncbi:MAG: hypothetical protein DHS20C11_15090 [Lysobacteraceae bacterium]|nr:MAG: hypothetical protein DHS20C11_15090 [Xanthomonadaceae bacterium]
MRLYWLLLISALPLTTLAGTDTFYVAVDGDDTTGDGTSGNPWATITHAVDNATDGSTILVGDGTYNGRVRLRRQFASQVTVRAENAYQARLRHNDGAALIAYEAQNITVEGLDIAHAPDNSGALVIQIQDLLGDVNGSGDGSDPVVSGITLRNNVIHDSTNNDLLKVNNGAEDILIEGNLFYHQSGSDEHIDANSVQNVVIQDNVFFNTSARPNTSSFIVIKDSNGDDDTIVGARDMTVRRNVFLNWYGSDGQSFLRIGEDGTSTFEAIGVLAENNLMIGNSAALTRTSFTVMGSNDVIYRNNTVTGDLPSRSYAARLIASSENPLNEDILMLNNAWSDPTGTMGAEGFNGVDVFDAPPSQNLSVTIDNNAYWNGGSAIPPDTGQFVTVADDSNAVLGDPMLPSTAGVVAPTFNGTTFADGSSTIREVFMNLVTSYGTPTPGSSLIDAADPGSAAYEDILGQARGPSPDIGAVETNPEDLIFVDDFE